MDEANIVQLAWNVEAGDPPLFFFTQLEVSVFAKSGGKYTRKIGWAVLHILRFGKLLLCSLWDERLVHVLLEIV